MSPAEVQTLLTAKPFKPFRLHFPSRTSYTVSSPGQVVSSRDGRTLMGPAMDGETHDMLDVIMVERIETLNEEPKEPMWWVQIPA